MNKIVLILFAGFLIGACNNSADVKNTTDSTAAKDNTNMYDTGAGRSMTDTSKRKDTSLLPNKMQDTGMKK